MADKAWKRSERGIARPLGGERVPVTGRQRGDVPDVKHAWLSIECKHRKALPAWLYEALDQARAAAWGEQLPIAVLHQSGERHSEDVVALRLSAFIEWFGADSTREG